jgi:hypothetical protein
VFTLTPLEAAPAVVSAVRSQAAFGSVTLAMSPGGAGFGDAGVRAARRVARPEVFEDPVWLAVASAKSTPFELKP